MTVETRYAVHTTTCTYLLDEEGVCRWIVSPTGMVPPEVRFCVGAQFVACLDPAVGGGLVGELRLGTAALFVRRDPETGRMLLLRTRRIDQVETRGGGALGGGVSTPAAPLHAVASAHADRSPEIIPAALSDDDIVTDTSEPAGLVLPGDEERTVTLTMPLYRPDSQPSMDGGRPPGSWRPSPPRARKSSQGTSGKKPPRRH